VDPDGSPVSWVPYGKEALLVADIDPALATRTYARRYKPDLYPS